MEYSKEYVVDPMHIDVHGIVDGLYYPFYMEYCRHAFIADVLSFDLKTEAENGVNMVLTDYSISFLRSLKKGDKFAVTCKLYAAKPNLPKLHFRQEIICNGKVMTKATFTGTCVPAAGGRAYLPDKLQELLRDAPELEL